MTDQPQGVNLKYSSFAMKEGYKPPTSGQLNNKNEQKRQRFTPGGDWGNDTIDQPVTQLPVTTKPVQKVNEDFLDDIIDVQNKEENTTSKFKFIKKPNKTEKTATMNKEDGEKVILDFDSVRSER